MISELLIISLKDPTLHQDSEEVLKQLLELLKNHPLNGDLDLSTEVKILAQLFWLVDSITVTLEDKGRVISRDSVEDLVKTLSEIYAQFLIRRYSELTYININILVSERIQRLHRAFYDTVTRLSLLYSVNFYKTVHYNLCTPNDTELLIENISRLIENILEYLKTAIYLDQKDDIPRAPRTSAAISDVDFIFDLLSKLEETEIERLLTDSREKLMELIVTIKYLLIPPTPHKGLVSLSPLVFSEREKHIYIDNKDIIVKVLSAWSRCILNMTSKIVEDNQDEQHQDHNLEANTPLEEFLNMISKQAQKLTEMYSRPFNHDIFKYPEASKNYGSTKWVLDKILIENIVELYEVFECSLTFKPESKIVVLRVKKLEIWLNIGLDSEKFKEIYDYLQSTKLQKYISGCEMHGAYLEEKGLP